MSQNNSLSKNARSPIEWLTRDYAREVLDSLTLPGELEQHDAPSEKE